MLHGLTSSSKINVTANNVTQNPPEEMSNRAFLRKEVKRELINQKDALINCGAAIGYLFSKLKPSTKIGVNHEKVGDLDLASERNRYYKSKTAETSPEGAVEATADVGRRRIVTFADELGLPLAREMNFKHKPHYGSPGRSCMK